MIDKQEILTEAIQRPEVLTILQLLRHRHGSVPAVAAAQINSLGDIKLDELSIALFDFRQLTDLEIWLALHGPAQRICETRYLGRLAYAEALTLQQSLHEARKRDEISDTLLLLEHPHVITLGRAANRANILADEPTRAEKNVEVFETGRGGDVTYHGPGQLVGYPIINLAPDRCDVRRYVRDIEEVLIRVAGDFGITAGRIAGLSGVWVGEEKLAAIGVRISRWVTMHGFAFNITTDLDYFNLIIPCGISDHGVTSLEKILGTKIELTAVAKSVVQHFGAVFQRQMLISNAEHFIA